MVTDFHFLTFPVFGGGFRCVQLHALCRWLLIAQRVVNATDGNNLSDFIRVTLIPENTRHLKSCAIRLDKLKANKIIAAVGFYGSLLAFIYYVENGGIAFVIYIVGALYLVWRMREDPDYLDKLPPFIRGVAEFAVSTFLAVCAFIVLGICIWILFL